MGILYLQNKKQVALSKMFENCFRFKFVLQSQTSAACHLYCINCLENEPGSAMWSDSQHLHPVFPYTCSWWKEDGQKWSTRPYWLWGAHGCRPTRWPCWFYEMLWKKRNGSCCNCCFPVSSFPLLLRTQSIFETGENITFSSASTFSSLPGGYFHRIKELIPAVSDKRSLYLKQF